MRPIMITVRDALRSLIRGGEHALHGMGRIPGERNETGVHDLRARPKDE